MKTRNQFLGAYLLLFILVIVFFNSEFKTALWTDKKIEKQCEESSGLLYPEDNPESDRILEQLDYRPCKNRSEPKTILMRGGMDNWDSIDPSEGQEVFYREECPVNNCILTSDISIPADLVISFSDQKYKPPGELWMMYLLESPFHSTSNLNGVDWTATYRRDSTIVAPYAKWKYYDKNVTSKVDTINYARNKSKQVAWFVSNCNAENKRLEYARELQKYITVDIFGSCSDKVCPYSSEDCMSMLSKDYKFYLSFENSNCRDYITEKFFYNALQHDVVPIVMGASLDDYTAVAPQGSFIHVDQFESVEELATYLHTLDTNDHLYNQYFQWKGTGEFIKTKFFCRVCAMLHYAQENNRRAPTNNTKLSTWWSGPEICKGTSGGGLYSGKWEGRSTEDDLFP